MLSTDVGAAPSAPTPYIAKSSTPAGGPRRGQSTEEQAPFGDLVDRYADDQPADTPAAERKGASNPARRHVSVAPSGHAPVETSAADAGTPAAAGRLAHPHDDVDGCEPDESDTPDVADLPVGGATPAPAPVTVVPPVLTALVAAPEVAPATEADQASASGETPAQATVSQPLVGRDHLEHAGREAQGSVPVNVTAAAPGPVVDADAHASHGVDADDESHVETAPAPDAGAQRATSAHVAVRAAQAFEARRAEHREHRAEDSVRAEANTQAPRTDDVQQAALAAIRGALADSVAQPGRGAQPATPAEPAEPGLATAAAPATPATPAVPVQTGPDTSRGHRDEHGPQRPAPQAVAGVTAQPVSAQPSVAPSAEAAAPPTAGAADMTPADPAAGPADPAADAPKAAPAAKKHEQTPAFAAHRSVQAETSTPAADPSVHMRDGEQVAAARPRPSAHAAQAIAAFQAVAAAVSAPTPLTTSAPAMETLRGSALLDQELPMQIVQAIRIQNDQGGGQARLRLNPGFLGGMTVDVRLDGNAVVAALQASSAEVREWIRTNEAALRQSLADQGLHLERLVVVDEDAPAQSDDDRKQGQPDQQPAPRRQRRPEGTSTFEALL